MFETWIGPENFRRGIRSYLDQYADRNADVTNFVEALDRGAGSDMARPFSTFLDQPGAPVISMALRCNEGKPPSLNVSQKRLLPQGSRGSTEEMWRAPVCIAYETDGRRKRECTLLSSRSAEWTLEGTKSCPAWISGNADGSGYYHVRYEGELLDRIIADGGRRLTPPERLSTVGDVEALFAAGELPATVALGIVPRFSSDGNRFVVQSLVNIIRGVRTRLVPLELTPNYSRFVTKTFADRATTIGWKASTAEDTDTRLLRPELLQLVTAEGNSPALRTEARELARA
jgi:alanyl aminopeptidase